MRVSKIIVLFSFINIFTDLVFSQSEVRFERVALDQGLSQNSVNSIIQDRYGFMWFGTQDGLNRFDGFSFKYYFNEPSNLNSLVSNEITYLYQSNNGFIWLGTLYDGLDRFNPLKNEFKHFQYIENAQNCISNNHVNYIAEDKNGNLWIATSGGGLNFFNTTNETFTHYLHDNKNNNSLASNDINAIAIDKEGNLWIGTSSDLEFYDLKSKKFMHYVLGYESFDQTKQISINTLHLDKNDLLWIGTSGGLFTFSKSKNSFHRYSHDIAAPSSLSHEYVNVIFEDSFGDIWIGTEHGLNKYLSKIDGFENYYADPAVSSSLSSNQIKCLYEDRSNIIWIGTKGGGANKLDIKRKKFYNLRYTANSKVGLPNPYVTCVTGTTDGNVWIGTDGGGACLFNKDKSNVINYKQKFDKKSSLSDDQILSSLVYKNKVWLGLHTGGLNVLDLSTGSLKIKKYLKTNDSTGLLNNQVNCLLVDNKGFLWAGTRNGLNKLIDTAKNGREYFIAYSKDYSNTNSISDNDISAIYQDHLGYIWIGTYSSGLNRLNPETGKVDHYISQINNISTIGSNNIHTIFEDHLGILWVGTAGGGLNMFNQDGKTFTRFMKKDGLASNEVMSILEDYSGFLWVSTSKGLSKFDPLSKQFTNFDVTDGILSDGFSISSAFQDGMGWLYFGTSAGLVYFDPTEIQLNPHQPDIVITKFTFLLDNQMVEKDIFVSKDNQEDSKIVLDYDKNIFSIEFAAMDFTNPAKNHFQYMIEGINKTWVDYGNKRSIMITNLEPGNYTLRIRGSNNDGVYNDIGIALPIIIKPPFYKTNLFYLILIIILLLLIVTVNNFIVKLKTNRILALKNLELEQANQRLTESEKSLKELNNTKDKFFSIIAHDLRNPFNPLLALTELLDDDYKHLEEEERIGFIKEIRHGAKKLYDLLENLLNWALSQTKQIKFNPVEINLNEIIKSNIELLTINAEKKGLTIVDNCEGEAMVVADENMLNSTVRNLLNNAIKFTGENSKIEVILFDEPDFFKVEVKDQGPGIPAENLETIFSGITKNNVNKTKGKGSGLGLILCKEFVEKNEGKIWVESNNGGGCSFIFTVKKSIS